MKIAPTYRLFFFLAPIAFCMLVASCSPEARLARLLKKHPELAKRDTVFYKDTIRIPESKTDTVFKNTITQDTVVIVKDNLTIKYFNSRDSIFISGKCDSIIKIVNVPVEVKSFDTTPRTWWEKQKDLVIAAMLGAIFISTLLLIFLLKTKTNLKNNQ